ncbi:MAG: hypothetical protein ACYTFQ_32120, partial [Planctomycetota bacterium]
MLPDEPSDRFGFDGAVFGLEQPIVIAPDDPLNPFRHLFHPDHDDPNESYEITRDLLLGFSSGLAGASMVAGWGDTDIGGLYSEALTGLHKQTIYVEGT